MLVMQKFMNPQDLAMQADTWWDACQANHRQVLVLMTDLLEDNDNGLSPSYLLLAPNRCRHCLSMKDMITKRRCTKLKPLTNEATIKG